MEIYRNKRKNLVKKLLVSFVAAGIFTTYLTNNGYCVSTTEVTLFSGEKEDNGIASLSDSNKEYENIIDEYKSKIDNIGVKINKTNTLNSTIQEELEEIRTGMKEIQKMVEKNHRKIQKIKIRVEHDEKTLNNTIFVGCMLGTLFIIMLFAFYVDNIYNY